MTAVTPEPLHSPVPLAKGWYGVDYRTQIGLHHLGASTTSADSPLDPSWDCYVGPLPFLLANSEEDRYIRESTDAKRDRFDAARDPGENSLDSNIWLRSWTSWHLGAGQQQAEPLEQDADEARFRFHRSAGVDVWTAGHMTLLRAPVKKVATGARRAIGVPGKGVVTSTATGVSLVTATGSTSLSTVVGTSLAVTTTRWVMRGDDGKLYYGDLAGGGQYTANITGVTALVTAKERLWVGAGPRLYEVTDYNAPSPQPTHTFADGVIVDIDSGPGGVYVMVVGAVTTIHVVTVAEDGTLNPPREVAVLPRGETGQLLYGYLSRYLVVGTTKGVRIADCSEASTLPLGPVNIVMEGQGCVDAVADGNFVYISTGDENIDTMGDGSAMRPGLYRIDLSRITLPGQQFGDTAASRYAWATDMYGDTPGLTSAVTVFDGHIWFVAAGALYMSGDTPMPYGWLDTGEVSFTTSERKAWQSLTLNVSGSGTAALFSDTGFGFRPASQTILTVPYVGDVLIDTHAHPTSSWMELRLVLIGGGPKVEAFGLRAWPAPRRTRFIRIPLSCFDLQTDRNQVPVGYDGFAYDRVRDLEALEQSGEIISITDMRTAETIDVQIERVSFSGVTPPDRVRGNFGGICTLTVVTI